MKLGKILLFILGISLSYSLPAWADQCSYITKEQALMAAARLKVGQTIYQLCEPCGETIPAQVTIESLSVGSVGYEDFWQVNVNDIGIDLAYIFIDSGIGNAPINLAGVIGCPARDISTVLPTK